MSTGKEYELLVHRIFQDIIAQTQLKNLNVQHNVILKGKDTKHQIDIYWKFSLADIEYETIIQAKDWNSPVTKGELLEFKAVLEDLPGKPKGIFVTRTGYQKGALEVAKANEILLYELREKEQTSIKISQFGFALGKIIPNPVYLPGGGVTFVIEIRIFKVEFGKLILTVDKEWLNNNLTDTVEYLSKKIESGEISKNNQKFVIFYDSDEREIDSLDKVQQRFSKQLSGEKIFSQNIQHDFIVPTFVKILPENKLLKILSISSHVSAIETEKIQSFMHGPDIVHFVLKNLSDGTQRIVNKLNS